MFICLPVFALNKVSSLYQRADFAGISAARPRIYICTKNPPPRMNDQYQWAFKR